MAGQGPDAVAPDGVMYCVNHPKTETLLRCSKCLDPICGKCAIKTPVGYRCPRCAQMVRSPLYVLQPQHYLIGFAVALALSLVGGALMARAGLFIALFMGAPVGGLIAEAVNRSLHGKRGRPLQYLTAASIALGAILGPWAWAVLMTGSLAVLPVNPLAYIASVNLSAVAYAVVAIVAAVARLY